MPTIDDLDEDKLAEAALAILSLSGYEEHSITRVWKGMDWDLLNILHERGWISDPKSKAKSVILTDEGITKAQEYLLKHFSKEK